MKLGYLLYPEVLCNGARFEADTAVAFIVSTYTPDEGQHIWNEAFCCPLCGEIWARRIFFEAEGSRWAFEPRECGSPFISQDDLDYFLLSELDPSPEQMKVIIHEYARCADYYRSNSPRA